MQSSHHVKEAYGRIQSYIHMTPLLYCPYLNTILKSNIYFKMDSLQKTGAFKIRGVLNHLLALKEKNKLPSKVVTYSTGNHGLAISYVVRMLAIHARIYLPDNVSPMKQKITREYGAEVIIVPTRQQAEDAAQYDATYHDFHYLHPSDDDHTIAGAGTLCYEAIMQMLELDQKPDVIFAPCGGGGLLAGSYLAKELLLPKAELHGVEPANADDAYRSLSSGVLFRFQSSPSTFADGLRALSVPLRTLEYLKKLDAFHLVSEELLQYWAAWLIQVANINCEPSAAISMAAAHTWLKNQIPGHSILILITGGNMDREVYQMLKQLPLKPCT